MISVRQERERGFSLIEVLVSLGLLAGVMVAVSSLFIFGGKEVKSGKKMTEAYSVGHDIVEEMDRMTYTQAYQYFLPSGTDTSTATNYTVNTKTSPAPVSDYQSNIDSKLYNGQATINVEALDASGNAVGFDLCVALRISVTVQWDEGTQTRYLNLRTVRF